MTLLLIRVDQLTGGPSIAFRGVRVEGSSTGWNEVTGPAQLVDPEHVLFDRARQAALRGGEDPATVGRELWDLVFEGDEQLGEWWRGARTEAGGNTRTALHIGVSSLRDVPWELLAPPPGQPPVFRQTVAPWVRAYKTPWEFPEPLTIPIQLLVIMGADRDSIAVDPEVAAIHRAVRDSPRWWNIEFLDKPAEPNEVSDLYGTVKPDIVHFIGHGRQIAGEQGLWMEGPQGPWLLTPSLIAEWPAPPPRLVVLNACRSAKEAERETDSSDAAEENAAAWSAVDAFVERGTAAVIAMQGDVDSVSAVAFSGTLYEGLDQGKPVDEAAAKARQAVSGKVAQGVTDAVSWALPALTVTADPDVVLPIRGADHPLTAPPYAEAAQLVAHCVDRAVERRLLWSAIDPAYNDEAGSLCLVTGEASMGKSAFVVSSLLTLRLRNRNVVYVDMEKHRRDPRRLETWLSVLRAVRDAIWEEGWLPSAAVEHRDRFNHELSFLLRQKDPSPWTNAIEHTDPGGEYVRGGEYDREWIERMIESFVTMLNGATGGEALLVVLDSLRAVEPSDVNNYLSPRLFEPAANDITWPYLRFVVVGRPNELDYLGPRTTSLATKVKIKPFKKIVVGRLARETFALSDIDPPMDMALQIIDNLPADVLPGELQAIVALVEAQLRAAES
jgi:CHAT domain